MIVTAAEFKTSLGKYLEMVSTEDIYITSNGKIVAQLIQPEPSAVHSLRGLLKNAPPDLDSSRIREERLYSYENHV